MPQPSTVLSNFYFYLSAYTKTGFTTCMVRYNLLTRALITDLGIEVVMKPMIAVAAATQEDIWKTISRENRNNSDQSHCAFPKTCKYHEVSLQPLIVIIKTRAMKHSKE